MKRFFAFFYSLKLTVILLTLLTMLIIPGALIHQSMPIEFYEQNVPQVLQPLFFFLDYNQFFSSPLFLTVIGIFTINLTTCTIRRFIKQIKRKHPYFGPDFLHTGIIILLLGALLSGLYRHSNLYELSPGDIIILDEKTVFLLDSAFIEYYKNGSIKDWVSKGYILNLETDIREEHEIRMNKPLSAAGYKLYQYQFREEGVLEILFRKNEYISIPFQQGIQYDNNEFIFQDVHQHEQAVIVSYNDTLYELATGSSIGDIEITDIKFNNVTTLNSAKDSAFTIIIIAFLMIAAGLILITIKRLKEALQ